jgi:hypothetical protein
MSWTAFGVGYFALDSEWSTIPENIDTSIGVFTLYPRFMYA